MLGQYPKKAKRTYVQPKTILRHVRELLADPKNFCRGQKERRFLNGSAQFCAVGGIEHFAANLVAAREARRLLKEAGMDGDDPMDINDRKGRKAIIAGLDKALT